MSNRLHLTSYNEHRITNAHIHRNGLFEDAVDAYTKGLSIIADTETSPESAHDISLLRLHAHQCRGLAHLRLFSEYDDDDYVERAEDDFSAALCENQETMIQVFM